MPSNRVRKKKKRPKDVNRNEPLGNDQVVKHFLRKNEAPKFKSPEAMKMLGMYLPSVILALQRGDEGGDRRRRQGKRQGRRKRRRKSNASPALLPVQVSRTRTFYLWE